MLIVTPPPIFDGGVEIQVPLPRPLESIALGGKQNLQEQSKKKTTFREGKEFLTRGILTELESRIDPEEKGKGGSRGTGEDFSRASSERAWVDLVPGNHDRRG
ncbi:hypothetical protein R1flu_008283 [Riccia fluitans]|uniref:Uncharacterized protein n=1 Tax=Riccia fluitans TaxID=41844 RepID=A0ABD1YB95_9MARC